MQVRPTGDDEEEHANDETALGACGSRDQSDYRMRVRRLSRFTGGVAVDCIVTAGYVPGHAFPGFHPAHIGWHVPPATAGRRHSDCTVRAALLHRHAP